MRLVNAIGLPELASDTRFSTFASRRSNADALLPMLERVFASRPASEWLDILGRAGVPCSPVNTVADALRDEQTAARGMVVDTEHPRFGAVRQLRSPVRVGAGRARVPASTPARRTPGPGASRPARLRRTPHRAAPQ